MTDQNDRPTAAEESALRRKAKKLGYALQKSRARLNINNHGQYCIIDPFQNAIVAGERFDMSAADVEDWLMS